VAVAVGCLAGLPSFSRLSFNSHSFAQPGIHSRCAYARGDKNVGGWPQIYSPWRRGTLGSVTQKP
jgi:hypothetical protein